MITDTYNPASTIDRRKMASELMAMLVKAGFQWEGKTPGTTERVYSRPLVGGREDIILKVFTTIEGQSVRECGEDAIRICSVYNSRDGKPRYIYHRTVHRTGTIDATVNRTLARMREGWALTKVCTKCGDCGAPLFKSKKGNMVCGDLCWKG